MTINEEREMLRATVAALVAKHASPAAVRAAMESDRGYDESLWQLLCEQVGAAALVIPEELGGAGGELADAATVLQELGRALVPSPLLGTTLAELALLAAPEPDAETLEGLAEGSLIGALVLDAEYVVNGDIADVVVDAGGDGRLSRWTRFSAEPVGTMDPTRRLARVRPEETEDLGADAGIADTAAVLLAAEQVGAAERCLELTVEYTKSRVQFGRPIGSFQALKHRMADLYVGRRGGQGGRGRRVRRSDAHRRRHGAPGRHRGAAAVAAEGIQLHGGIAITWEHDMHLYFKRAHGSAHLLDSPRELLRRLESEVLRGRERPRRAARRHPTVLCDGCLAGRRRAPAQPRRSGEPLGGPAQRRRTRTGACGRGRRAAPQRAGLHRGAGHSGAACRDRRGLPDASTASTWSPTRWWSPRAPRAGSCSPSWPASTSATGWRWPAPATRAIETSCRRWGVRWSRSPAGRRPVSSRPLRCSPNSTRRCRA